MVDSVQLFITCLIDTLYPEIGDAVVEVLGRLGIKPEFPNGQTCCGQPAFNAGLRHQARPVAQHTIQLFEKTRGPIVIPSGSCTGMIRHGYPELFADDPQWYERACALAERTFEFTEFLVDYLGVTDLGARWAGKVTYHSSCHLLRDLGVDRQPRLLLKAVQGAEFVELPYSVDCCGFGGVFSVEHPELSSAMLARKLENIRLSEALTVVVCDAGCMTNIQGGLRRTGMTQQVVHIAQILTRNN
jgi:L-lactate dehydrogenase complex protein LldE